MNVEPQTKLKQYGYVGGTFSDEEIAEARERNIPLTLDCALPGPCLNDCTYCGFLYVNDGNKLHQHEILRVFKEFADLGGKSIKILGEGEPLLRKDIFFLLRRIRELNMIPVLFTCGDVLGSEDLAQQIHSRSCKELVLDLYESGVTIMLKYEKKAQDDIVQRRGYSILREIALEHLLNFKFNTEFPTRLGFSIVLTKENYHEVSDVFSFALHNDIYPLVCPLMPIGKMKCHEYLRQHSPDARKIAELSERLSKLCREQGIYNCVSISFPGGLPCDISRVGLYMDDVGDIKVCEADDSIGSIKDCSLFTLWQKCSGVKNKKYGDMRWKGFCFPKLSEGILFSTESIP